MALNHCKKADLVIIARELGEKLPEGATIAEIKKAIEKNDTFLDDPKFVKNFIDSVVEERKERELSLIREKESQAILNQSNLELEKIKLAQLEKELELQRLKNLNSNTSSNSALDENSLNDSSNKLEILLKSVKTLSLPVPSKPENFHLFFQSLEKAFVTKSVPEYLKSEILINILGEKANRVIMYASETEIKDYKLLKDLVLKEYQPTATEILRNFQSAQKSNHESYMQFASRLSASFEYYCKVRKVTDFKTLCDLTVADRIFQTLDKETKSHITVRQGQEWFPPKVLAKECDVYLDSRPSNYSRSTYEVKKMSERPTFNNTTRRFHENKVMECYVCKGNHFARNCPQKISNENVVSGIRIEQSNLNVQNALQFVNICIDGKIINCLCDSGAEINCVKKYLFPSKPTQESTFLTSCFGERKRAGIATFDYALTRKSPRIFVKAALVENLTVDAIVTPAVLSQLQALEEKNAFPEERDMSHRASGPSRTIRKVQEGRNGAKEDDNPPVENNNNPTPTTTVWGNKFLFQISRAVEDPSAMDLSHIGDVYVPREIENLVSNCALHKMEDTNLTDGIPVCSRSRRLPRTVQRTIYNTKSRSTKRSPFQLHNDVKTRNKKEAKKYEVDDVVAIRRTQFGTGQKLRPRFHGYYRITNTKPKDWYDVRKIGIHPGSNITLTAADSMKQWPNDS